MMAQIPPVRKILDRYKCFSYQYKVTVVVLRQVNGKNWLGFWVAIMSLSNICRFHLSRLSRSYLAEVNRLLCQNVVTELFYFVLISVLINIDHFRMYLAKKLCEKVLIEPPSATEELKIYFCLQATSEICYVINLGSCSPPPPIHHHTVSRICWTIPPPRYITL